MKTFFSVTFKMEFKNDVSITLLAFT